MEQELIYLKQPLEVEAPKEIENPFVKKDIKVDLSIHKRLAYIKLKEGFKSMSDVIKSLLDR